MFNFLMMSDDYQDRVVDNYTDGIFTIDTARVTDSEKDYETAVVHPKYNYGKCLIVETYDTKEQAQVGHTKWVELMTAETLPDKLVDVSSAGTAQLLDIFDKGDWRTYNADTQSEG